MKNLETLAQRKERVAILAAQLKTAQKQGFHIPELPSSAISTTAAHVALPHWSVPDAGEERDRR